MTISPPRRSSGLPNYVVLRAAPCAEGEVPEALLGQWLNLGDIPQIRPPDGPETITLPITVARAEATSTFEVHEVTGEVAEVYLIHRCGATCG